METGQLDRKDVSFSTPLPITPEKILLDKIEGDIHIKTVVPDKNNEDYYKMMMEIWKLSEYRKSLSSSKPEKEWLEECENNYSNTILGYIQSSAYLSNSSLYPAKEDIIKFIKKEMDFSKEEIVSFMVNTLLSNQK
ncbi:MAG: hypothetical protein QM791_10545 [Ferruginibacter sp.]